MNRWLIILLLFLVPIATSPVLAEMPEPAQAELRSILAQTEFQPRVEQKSTYEQLKEQALIYVGQKFADFVSWLRDALPRLPRSEWLNSTVLSILDRLNRIFQGLIDLGFRLGKMGLALLVIGFVTFVGYRLYAKYLRTVPDQTELGSDDTYRPDFQALANLTDPLKLLEEMRLALRWQFKKRHGFSLTLTDREVMRKIAQGESSRELFGEVAQNFERASFGRQRLESDRIRAIFQNNQEIFMGLIG